MEHYYCGDLRLRPARLTRSSPGGRKSGEVDCGPTEQAEYCVGRGPGGLHHDAEKFAEKKIILNKMVRI